ncbi:MAG: hypothetical protein LUG83_04975, partial [Lachnospiraceae bacterium]|nr:hypothetical protein [Lachnospiraceae bacterium]
CNIYDKLPDKIVDGETELPDMFLRFINRRYAMITTDYFEKNSLKDEFCNREFNISMDII